MIQGIYPAYISHETFLANRSNFGRNAVAVALGVGGALIALTLILMAGSGLWLILA